MPQVMALSKIEILRASIKPRGGDSARVLCWILQPVALESANEFTNSQLLVLPHSRQLLRELKIEMNDVVAHAPVFAAAFMNATISSGLRPGGTVKRGLDKAFFMRL